MFEGLIRDRGTEKLIKQLQTRHEYIVIELKQQILIQMVRKVRNFDFKGPKNVVD